jgi:hypothetical protein
MHLLQNLHSDMEAFNGGLQPMMLARRRALLAQCLTCETQVFRGGVLGLHAGIIATPANAAATAIKGPKRGVSPESQRLP